MHKLFFIVSLLFFSPLSFSQTFIGDWKGSINANGHEIPVIFHFIKNTDGKLSGKWDSPSQGAIGLPFSTIDAREDSLTLGIAAISGSYQGKLIGPDSIEGVWHQGGASLPLNFKKFIDDSQTRDIVYPNEKQIVINSANGIRLYGTLLSRNNNQKLAIIIAGSGPTDRDGNSPMGDKASSYKMLAHALDSNGIASFRFDKRGVGQSVSPDFNESKLTFYDYIKDAGKIFDYLHDTLGFKNIYFIGHSEGSLIGMIASQKTTTRAFISLAGAGRPIDKIIEEQMDNQPIPDSLKKEITVIFKELKNGREVGNVSSSLNAIFRKSVQPYMISWLKYSPAAEIKKLTCPVLIIQGTCDMQVHIIDAENLHNANKQSILTIIPSMTHTLKDADANCNDENRETYMNPNLPLNTKLVNDVVTFINK